MTSNELVAATTLTSLGRLLRPRHWVKNGFVLAPLIFSGSFVHAGAVAQALLVALLFCVAASAAYVFNDLMDAEADRLHPAKVRSRPLASGQVTPGRARALLGVLWAMLLPGFLLAPRATGVIGLYVLLNVAYSLKLKNVPVVDLFTLATGFALRVLAGAVAIAVPLSAWTLITTLCLALYLAAVKRRDELALAGNAGRRVLHSYTVSLLDRYAERAALGAMVFYCLFVVTVRPVLVATVPLVLFGLFRYSFIVDRASGGESPTDSVLRDTPLLVTVLAWAGLCAFLLWPRS
jgi:4-hydroxybenzoate polyprenyltransferase